MYFHKFFSRHSLDAWKGDTRFEIAMACLFMSAKSHDHVTKRLIEQIVGNFIGIAETQKKRQGQKVMSDDEKQSKQARTVGRVLENESHVLTAIEFEFEQPFPYGILETCLLKLFRDHAEQPQPFLESLSQKEGFQITAWWFVTDSLHTSLYSHYPPVAVVVAAMHLTLGLPEFKSIADALASSAVKSETWEGAASDTTKGEPLGVWHEVLFGVGQGDIDLACEQILLASKMSLPSSKSASSRGRGSSPQTADGSELKKRAATDEINGSDSKRHAVTVPT